MDTLYAHHTLKQIEKGTSAMRQISASIDDETAAQLVALRATVGDRQTAQQQPDVTTPCRTSLSVGTRTMPRMQGADNQRRRSNIVPALRFAYHATSEETATAIVCPFMFPTFATARGNAQRSMPVYIPDLPHAQHNSPRDQPRNPQN